MPTQVPKPIQSNATDRALRVSAIACNAVDQCRIRRVGYLLGTIVRFGIDAGARKQTLLIGQNFHVCAASCGHLVPGIVHHVFGFLRRRQC